MRCATILLCALLLTACARHVWVKDGATLADYERDKSACTYEAARAGDPIFAAMFLPDCMRGRGWVSQVAVTTKRGAPVIWGPHA